MRAMVDRSGNWADDKLLGQRIETVLGLKQWIVDDAAGLAEQLYERLSVDELHELQLARDERLAEYCQGTWRTVPGRFLRPGTSFTGDRADQFN